MSALDEQWLQDVAESMGIPALGPTVVKMMLPVIEAHIKKITQQAHKFQRRSKAKTFTVEDINSALALNKIEPVYGLSRPEHTQLLGTGTDTTNGESSSNKPTNAFNKKLVNLVEFGKTMSLVPCPLKPEATLHWLAVNGSQPVTADNPSMIAAEPDDQPVLLPKELQNLYARIVGIVQSATGSASSSGLSAVLTVLRTDTGIQELTPHLSRCFYQQIRANNKRLVLLSTIVRAIKALLCNPAVDLEFHLQQLVPSVFTCVVAAKLGSSVNEDHWALRSEAAEVISLISFKYSTLLPELHARMCKTYLDALSPDKTLGTLYGAIVGLSALGSHIVRTLLIPSLQSLEDRILPPSGDAGGVGVLKTEGSMPPPTGSSSTGMGGSLGVGEKRKRTGSVDADAGAGSSSSSMVVEGAATGAGQGESKSVRKGAAASALQNRREVSMCKQALLRALGKYVVHNMRLPDIGQTISFSGGAATVRGAAAVGGPSQQQQQRSAPPLCELEEALVPYYASASKQDYYCRLML